MDPRLFLNVMVSLMLIPSLICLFLPDTIAHVYTELMFPLVLLIGAILSIKVASIYKKWLRKAFIFLSLFLFFMIFPHIEFLWGMYSSFPLLVAFMQWITYAMLVLCSFYILRVTGVRKISRKGWVIIAAMLFIGMIILVRYMPSVLNQQMTYAHKISLPLIYLLDIAIVIMLLPVVLLYAQQMRLEKRESITFTAIICGIILSLIVDYITGILSGTSLSEMQRALHTGSPIDALYLFSYLVIAVGLYVHKKYDEWGFQMMEKALELEGGLKSNGV